MIITPENWKSSNQFILALSPWYPGVSQPSLSDYLLPSHLIKNKKVLSLATVKCFFLYLINSHSIKCPWLLIEIISTWIKWHFAVFLAPFGTISQIPWGIYKFVNLQTYDLMLKAVFCPCSSSEFSHFKLLSDISPPEKQEQMGGICHPRVGPPQPWSKQTTLLILLLFHNKSPFGVLPLVIKEASHACGCSQAVATAAEDMLLGGSAQLSPSLQSFY